ncbi:triose-phosphate isomerase [Wenxinia marina]|uniref:Triosephosphate isomerase n=1 Tax=Wenxinia marina DSM 24838 TaxID=1123501 RepID=A0A0D0PDP2_9RHOB|nr:triose-phosphate isomerase [Wenxinia marina]KIQ69566.1 triosephosphate isomerase [Wenxinia marina DSM 24838]GGL59405.1 triosephosphate isomerase [Wenxinia marina]
MPRKLAAGNWKMNGTLEGLSEIAELGGLHRAPSVDILICPPATLLSPMARAAQGTSVWIGGQDCHAAASGAHTGDVSAGMLSAAGAAYVIVGHSERRTDHGEDDGNVRAKAEAAWRAGLVAIVCLGETLEERESGRALDVVARQLAGSVPDGATAANTVVAYEPVWAIGTGKVAGPTEIGEVHAAMRAALTQRFGDEGAQMRLLYGGSVKASNAAEIFAVPHVDGALVGGASLKASDFSPIVTALEQA